MRWPWAKTEARQAEDDGGDAVLAELLRQQGRAASMLAGAGVAVEQAAGLWARAFASARATPDARATRTLTPSVLAHIGRQLALRGEAVFAIDSTPDGLRLAPASSWDVLRGWRYRVDVPMPERTATRTLPAEAVVHCRYAVKPDAPWRGLSPLHFCPNTADLAGRIDLSLSNEYRGPVGTVLFGSENSAGMSEDDLANLTKDLQSGRMVAIGQHNRDLNLNLVPPANSGVPQSPDSGGGYGDSGWLPPNTALTSDRIGPNPPAVVNDLRNGIGDSVLAAYGVPPTLYATNAASAREAWRQFLYATIAPVAKLCAEELANKLMVPRLQFDFSELQASDVTGRARAFRSLVEAGMNMQEARAVAGV